MLIIPVSGVSENETKSIEITTPEDSALLQQLNINPDDEVPLVDPNPEAKKQSNVEVNSYSKLYKVQHLQKNTN